VASSTGTSLFTVTQGGNVGVGTTTPGARFSLESGNGIPLIVSSSTYRGKASSTLMTLDAKGGLFVNSYRGSFNNYDYLPLISNINRGLFSAGSSTATSYDGNLSLGIRRNLWQYTEDFASNRYTAGTLTTKTGATTTWNGIVLSQATTTGNFYNSIRTQYQALGIDSLVPGQRYMFSYYIQNMSSNTTPETFVWMRTIESSTSPSHGSKLIDGTVRRIWQVCEAVTSSTVDCMTNPTQALGSGTSTTGEIYWLFGGLDQNNVGQALNLYIGGFQIEAVPTEKTGIAIIGDSTIAGSSGQYDAMSSRQISRYAEGIMNVPWFNRATGGLTCAQLDDEWDNDLAPVLVNSKYVVIQCGVNDSNQLVSTSTTRAEITSMYNKALAASTIPIVMTITPFEIISNPATTTDLYRNDTNAWIKRTFPKVLDIASVIQDYNATSTLNNKPTYFGDGTHYLSPANRLIGDYVAKSYIGNPYGYPEIWDFPQPSNYQKIETTTYSSNSILTINGSLNDSFSSPGTLGQVLSSTGTSTKWVTISGVTESGWTRLNGAIYTSTSTDSVGIGTSSPASKLDVFGSFRVGTSSRPLFLADPSTGNISFGTTSTAGTFTAEAVANNGIPFLFTASTSITQPFFRVQTGAGTNVMSVRSSSATNNYIDVGGVTTLQVVGTTAYFGSAASGGSYLGANGYTVSVGSAPFSAVYMYVAPPTSFTGDLFRVASSSNSVFNVTNSGRVGIGSSTPIAKLSVVGSAGINPLVVASSTDTQLFTVLQNGHVGIGTSTPGSLFAIQQPFFSSPINTPSPLSVYGAYAWGTAGAINLLAGTGDDYGGAINIIAGDGGTSGAGGGHVFISAGSGPSAGTEGNVYIDAGNGNADGTGYILLASRRNANVSIGSSTPVARLTIAGTSTLATLPLLDIASSSNASYFRITNLGNVGIGTTSPQRLLHVYRSTDGPPVRFEDSNGYCEIDPTSTSWTCTSDERLKKDIVTMSTSTMMRKVLALNPVTFRWKSQNTNDLRYGLIAQEVEEVFPDFVTTDERGFKSVSYGSFVPILISAFQDLGTRVDSIEESLAEIREDIENQSTIGNVANTILGVFDTVQVKKGFEVQDELTGDYWCVKIRGGEWVRVKGDCSQATAGGNEPVNPPPVGPIDPPVDPPVEPIDPIEEEIVEENQVEKKIDDESNGLSTPPENEPEESPSVEPHNIESTG
ncbi:MAG TPA: tail fiber domain-containing protein, partial [Candidatus Paceibacterota bacterium]|nr:tail fiber domain-containing protein [Candidatus Paceibacterota bacterium]